MNLARITCEYQASEDRIRISGLLENSQVEVLWLTCRLACRLVPALTLQLKRDHLAISNIAQQDILQSFQQAVVANHQASTAEPPVNCENATHEWLITHIDIKQRDYGVDLVFRNNQHQAILPLTLNTLRQWLNVLWGQFLQSQWPLDCWPNWMQNSPQQTTPTTSMH